MKALKSITFGLAALLLGTQSFAQVLSPEDDGIVPREERHYKHARVVPYSFLRQDDIMWSTRHWERIDLREKINHHLYYPIQPLSDRKSLFDVIKDGIMTEGTIVEVFRDDRFEIPLTEQEINTILVRRDTIRDPDDPTIILLVDEIEIKSPNIVFWDLKSDWYFDKQRGEMKNRIIGISPVVKDPQTKEIYNLFWVWFPDARFALATNVAYNVNNDMQRLSFDEVFQLRKFNAIVTKEENVYDRAIKDYKRNNSMDQLLESQRIKNELRNYEHDLWEF